MVQGAGQGRGREQANTITSIVPCWIVLSFKWPNVCSVSRAGLVYQVNENQSNNDRSISSGVALTSYWIVVAYFNYVDFIKSYLLTCNINLWTLDNQVSLKMFSAGWHSLVVDSFGFKNQLLGLLNYIYTNNGHLHWSYLLPFISCPYHIPFVIKRYLLP